MMQAAAYNMSPTAAALAWCHQHAPSSDLFMANSLDGLQRNMHAYLLLVQLSAALDPLTDNTAQVHDATDVSRHT